MNLATLIFGQAAFLINFYADQFLEQDRAQMLAQPGFADNLNLPIVETFDFIIVGGGAAGCLLANRLSKASFTVLLLESGGDPPPPTYVPGYALQFPAFKNIIYDYDSTPQNFPGTNSSRILKARGGKVLGGTSTLNYMLFNRGSPHDYDKWANITGDPDWTYANLLQYFKSIESYSGQHPSDQHGYNGDLTIATQAFSPGAQLFMRAGEELGYPADIDPNGPQRVSFTKFDVHKRLGQRMSSYEAFILRKADNLPNLVIRRYSTVQEILLDNTNTAYGVSYTRHGFPQLAYASKEVIISAGTFGSPQLLMKSGIGPAELLQSLNIKPKLNLPVGQNFQDHPVIPLQFYLEDNSEIYNPEQDLTPTSVTEFLHGAHGPLTSAAGLSSQAFLTSSYSTLANWPDLQFFLSFYNGQLLPTPENAKDHIIYLYVYLGRPKSIGTVSLSLSPNSKDGVPAAANYSPLIDYNFLSNPIDMEVYLEGIKFGLSIFENTTIFRSIGARYVDTPLEPCASFNFRSDEYWKCYVSHLIGSGGHPTSTCSMGNVVDSKLRVIGAQNLRVIDASTMPAVTNANIQAAVYVLAEKAAVDILQVHQA